MSLVARNSYFPLISGLVKELGGLLSHGAVVAREFGIPCIVITPALETTWSGGVRWDSWDCQ